LQTRSSADRAPEPEPRAYRYLVVISLAVIYMFNFIDRQLLSVLAEPVKRDLGLSDTQLGMLTGLMFALFYTVFGIPVALLADRWRRVRLIAVASGLWSLFTAASGLATGFLSLALARVGVGIGEAGCSPPSYSIISDYFPPERRGRALAIYVLGVPAGSFVGTLAGGWIAAHYGWRTAFFAIGLAGLLITPLILLIVREPLRGRFDPEESGPRDALTTSRETLWGAFAFFFRTPTLLLSALAAGATAFVSYGLINWSPAFLVRVQGMGMGQIAAYFGVCIAGAMIIGAWLGGWISDRAGARNPIFYALLPGLGLLAITPFLFAFTKAATWQASLGFMVVPLIATSTYLVPALTLQQNRTPARYRATASSILLFLINLTGLGCGPLFVGAVSDALQPRYGAHALGMALQWLTPFIVLAFALQCATAWTLRCKANPA